MNVGKDFSGKEILSWRVHQLSLGGNSFEIDWLLDLGGGLRRTDLQKLKLSEDRNHCLERSLDELAELWIRHLRERIPLQYLIGKCPWREFVLEVNSSVLIPRQETEILVDLALAKVQPLANKACRWCDLGTGSGAISVALAEALPTWMGHAVDFSPEALALARKNIENLVECSKVKMHLGNWLEPLKPWWGKFELVVANPPYIPKSTFKDLDPLVRDHEPFFALYGGEDGMDSFREICSDSFKALVPGGWLCLEHHFDQSQRMVAFLSSLGFLEINSELDFQGCRRFVTALRP